MDGAVIEHGQSQRSLGDLNPVDLGEADAATDPGGIVNDDFVARRLMPNGHLELRPRLGNARVEVALSRSRSLLVNSGGASLTHMSKIKDLRFSSSSQSS